MQYRTNRRNLHHFVIVNVELRQLLNQNCGNTRVSIFVTCHEVTKLGVIEKHLAGEIIENYVFYANLLVAAQFKFFRRATNKFKIPSVKAKGRRRVKLKYKFVQGCCI